MAGDVFLSTERLVLREFTPDDLELLVELDGDPEVKRFIDGGAPVVRDEVAEMLQWWLGYRDRFDGYGFWAAFEREGGRFVGWFHLRPGEDAGALEPELGYRLRRDAWGRGYATEASQALVDHAFTALGATTVNAETMAVNLGSRRVMEHVGMRLVREFHADWPVRVPGDEHGDVEYAVLRSEWEAQRGRPSPPDGSTRPIVHLTPPVGWMNDPNGLVHDGSTYHCCYQHHPHDTSWGPMHWAHATSDDLVTWTHHPVVLAPDEHGTIFSGSAVVDHGDTAGFGHGALVALFTYHTDHDESQGLAWSLDGGVTFTKWPGQVVPAPPDRRDFRDPKVLRFGGDAPDAGHWVMLLAVGHEIWILTSPDLRSWTRTDVIGGVFGDVAAWETPDLLRFDDCWVLAIGIGDGAPAGGSGVTAVTGDFDGERFTPRGPAWWVDHGDAFYAAQAWNDVPDGRHLWTAWMGNWHAPVTLPAVGWRGQMSVPREVSLRRCTDGAFRLVQRPVRELAVARRRSRSSTGATIAERPGRRFGVAAPALDIELVPGVGAIELRCERPDQVVTVLIDARRAQLSVLVRDAAVLDGVERAFTAPIELIPDDRIRIVLDVASVEVFAGTGTVSTLIRNLPHAWALSGGEAGVDRVDVWELAPHV